MQSASRSDPRLPQSPSQAAAERGAGRARAGEEAHARGYPEAHCSSEPPEQTDPDRVGSGRTVYAVLPMPDRCCPPGVISPTCPATSGPRADILSVEMQTA